MIIILKNADFSQSNIGTLSTWRITRSLGAGATYEGPTSIDKDAALSATVTLAEGYEIGAAGVTITMGGTVLSGAHSISGNVITITIASVTGNVLIKVPTVNTAGGEEEEPDVPDTPTTFTFTVNPTPSDATVNLALDDSSITTGASKTGLNANDVVWYLVTKEGYASESGRKTVTGNVTENITLTPYGESGTTIPLTWYKSNYYFTGANTQPEVYSTKVSMDRVSAENSGAGAANAASFWCTQIFTKETLPNGSIIKIANGYRYRPDGVSALNAWNTDDNRPGNVQTASVTVDDAWWGDKKYVGFNISATSGTRLDSKTEADLNNIFSITLP
jgi:hypothetical protein